jgi:hypothetical protein
MIFLSGVEDLVRQNGRPQGTKCSKSRRETPQKPADRNLKAVNSRGVRYLHLLIVAALGYISAGY